MTSTTVGWRLVEYRCRSCKEWCLLDHRESAAKYHECRSCHRVPELDQEIVDHRLTSLLWAHQLADELPTARTGEAERVSGGASAPSAASAEPAGTRGLAPDPEAGPQTAPSGRSTSGGERQSGLSGLTVVPDGGHDGED